MKKGFSILLVIIMLTAMLQLNVATHYCGGNVAATKVSVSGKLATCGMESKEKDYPPAGTRINTHCCDDKVTSWAIDNNYTPSFSIVPEFYQYISRDYRLSNGSPVLSSAILKSLYTNVSPPGALMSTNVDLSDICIFRI